MIKLNNILKELSSEYEDDYNAFIDNQHGRYSEDEWHKVTQPLKYMISGWIGRASNKKGMKVELFMRKHPDIYKYMKSTLKKHHPSGKIDLLRGMSFNVVDDLDFGTYHDENEPWIKRCPIAYNLYKRKRGKINLLSENIKYSSWTTQESVRNRFSGAGAPKYISLNLYASISIDDIIFCGELFERTTDDITDYEYIVKHDKMIYANFEVAYVGSGAKIKINQEEQELGFEKT